MVGTTVLWPSCQATALIAFIMIERGGEETAGKLSSTSTLIVSSPITWRIRSRNSFGSEPGNRRQSTSAYAVGAITLIFWLAPSTVGVTVSLTIALKRGVARNWW